MYRIISIIVLYLVLLENIIGNEKREKFSFNPKCTAVLKIEGFKSGNVIQGITNIRNLWILTQTNNNKKIIFTIFNEKFKLIKRIIINYPSHGQDLSSLRVNSGLYYLITSSQKGRGVAFFSFNIKSLSIKFEKEIILPGNGFKTVAISKEGTYIVIKEYDRIDIYPYSLRKINKPIFTFFLNRTQLEKKQWFQGLTMADGYIYTLSGDNKIDANKYLIVYDYFGFMVKKVKLNIGKKIALKEGKKWELEGLTIKDNVLYTTVMTGKDGKNIKRIYKILEIK